MTTPYVRWSEGWPTEPGWYWLWGDRGDGTALVPGLCEAIMQGFRVAVYDGEGFPVQRLPGKQWWAKATLPDPPKLVEPASQ